MNLPDPLAHLLSELPDLTELTYYESKTDAGVKLLREVKAKLIDSPHLTKVDQFIDIAKPIAHDMQLLKPSLVDKMEQYVQLRLSLTLTVIVFLGNLLMHVLMYLYHRFAIFRRLTLKFMKSNNRKIKLKPVLSVPAANRNEIAEKGAKIRETFIVNQEEMDASQTSAERSKRSSYCSSGIRQLTKMKTKRRV